MMQITDNSQEQKIFPLMRLAFRPFFLGTALYSLFALTLWALSLSGIVNFSPYGSLVWWHAHEMIFGFSFAVIIGFLLTAIQNWTGIPSVRSWNLLLLFTSWVVARIVLLIDLTPSYLVMAVDILTPLLAALFLVQNVVAAKHWKNLFFAPMLILFAIANTISHVAVIENMPQLSSAAFALLITLVTLVMCIIGGRVIPFFTAKGTGTEKTPPIAIIEFLSLVPLWCYVVLGIINSFFALPTELLSLLLFVSGLANLVRFVRWKPWITFRVPLLWSLHCAYLFIPLGLIAYSIATSVSPQNATNVLHLITVGAMGNLIIAMMSRVSLGHTGRTLSPKPVMSVAFLCVIIAAPVRALLVIALPQFTLLSYQLSAGLWVAGYTIFIACYAKMLCTPRADGRPG